MKLGYSLHIQSKHIQGETVKLVGKNFQIENRNLKDLELSKTRQKEHEDKFIQECAKREKELIEILCTCWRQKLVICSLLSVVMERIVVGPELVLLPLTGDRCCAVWSCPDCHQTNIAVCPACLGIKFFFRI